MSELLQKKCVPCEGGTPPLGVADVQRYMAELASGWMALENKKLRKEYRFPDFKTALAFVDRVGALAESEGHHPDIQLGWGRVLIELWTHAANGLTENDFILAAKTDELPKE
jgi:4a-hydroxytetrahydrobiopterin dehydratase